MESQESGDTLPLYTGVSPASKGCGAWDGNAARETFPGPSGPCLGERRRGDSRFSSLAFRLKALQSFLKTRQSPGPKSPLMK